MNSQKQALVSIIVPVYKEEKNIPVFVERIQKVLLGITEEYEIIFSLDPSPDKSRDVIVNCHKQNDRIKLITFSRRFGQPMATIAGLQYSTGKAAIVMDVDLQDPPELIVEMIQRWKEGFDVVYAQRKSRAGETFIKRVVSYWGYKLINKIADVDIPPNTGDFRLMSRRVVEELLKLKESHGFLRGLVALVGFKQCSVLFDRPPRYSGDGNYNRFLGSLRIGLNGIVCFSNYLLGLSSLLGFTAAGGSMFFAFLYFLLKIFGFPFPMGNPTIVILVLFLGGVQLISVGILGEYIGRIYDEVKQRPKFIVDELVGVKKAID